MGLTENEKELLQMIESKFKGEELERFKYLLVQDAMRFAKEQSKLFGVGSSNAVDYKKGFELAMDFINKHPADPDITNEQVDAWIKLQDFVKNNKEK